MTHGRPDLPDERYGQRLDAARWLAREAHLEALLIGVGADLRYLTGYVAMPLERLTMLVIPADGPFVLLAPRLELLPARGCPAARSGRVEVVAWEETEDPIARVADLVRGNAGPGGTLSPIAISDRLPAAFLLALQAALPGVSWQLASSVLRRLRMIKDADEIALLRMAAHAADRVILAIAAGSLVGRTEADIAREVTERLVAEGHDSAEFAIVASGPESASPHHEPSDRVVRPGEPIILDIGGPLGGYGSDTTRTIWVTGGDPSRGPDPLFRRIYALVATARREAAAAVRPGVEAQSIDAVARQVIAAGGHGDQFIHRVGHGIGLEGHEDPYLVAGNTEPLQIGMAFSIEPGIYLEGRYGVRIEDIVVCGPAGADVLDEVTHDLLIVDG